MSNHTLPTSNMDVFRDMLSNPGKTYKGLIQIINDVEVIKATVISHPSDIGGCGHIRNMFPMGYMNATYGRSGTFELIQSPRFINQPDILAITRSIFFQRVMNPDAASTIQEYHKHKDTYGYKMIYDIDDFIWEGDGTFEGLPKYNYGYYHLTKEMRDTSVACMRLMDTICVSTEYLRDYIHQTFDIPLKKFVIVPNTVAQFFWGTERKAPIKYTIKKPRVIWTGSPTHWNDDRQLPGDMGNAWQEWVRENVISGKIDYIQMGGCPYFFKDIEDKITIVPWVNSYKYHLVVKALKPDFAIGPLVPNHFNFSKSDLKAVEMYAIGTVFIGTVFACKMPSPYDDVFVKALDTVTVKDIDDLFWELTDPEKYNKVMNAQYEYMKTEGRYTESPRNVNLLASIF